MIGRSESGSRVMVSGMRYAPNSVLHQRWASENGWSILTTSRMTIGTTAIVRIALGVTGKPVRRPRMKAMMHVLTASDGWILLTEHFWFGVLTDRQGGNEYYFPGMMRRILVSLQRLFAEGSLPALQVVAVRAFVRDVEYGPANILLCRDLEAPWDCREIGPGDCQLFDIVRSHWDFLEACEPYDELP